MTYRSILVHLTDDPRNQTKIDVTIALARRFDAAVTALYTLPQARDFQYMGEYVPSHLFQLRTNDEMRALAQEAKTAFQAAGGVKTEWVESEKLPVEAVETHGRVFDLIVLGQPNPKPRDPMSLPAGVDVLPHEVALRAGRPILTVPYVGSYPEIGHRVMVAWNGSKEAARAVHDALPFLVGAEKTTVFSVDPDKMRGMPGAELGRHLAHHGVRVEVSHTVADNTDVGESLLSAVADDGADLLVMGAYGHSRLREMIFGGVTETMLGSATVPVLLSN